MKSTDTTNRINIIPIEGFRNINRHAVEIFGIFEIANIYPDNSPEYNVMKHFLKMTIGNISDHYLKIEEEIATISYPDIQMDIERRKSLIEQLVSRLSEKKEHQEEFSNVLSAYWKYKDNKYYIKEQNQRNIVSRDKLFMDEVVKKRVELQYKRNRTPEEIEIIGENLKVPTRLYEFRAQYYPDDFTPAPNAIRILTYTDPNANIPTLPTND